MFPLSFPLKILSNSKTGDIVFDPFCGRGTTNYAARLFGNKSYGIDSNPVAQAIAKAKLVSAKPEVIVSLCKDILETRDPIIVPVGEFWELAFHPETLIEICKLRHFLLSKDGLSDVEISLRAVILGVLHGPIMNSQPSYLSNQTPRTFAPKPNYSIKYWKRNNLFPKYVSVLDLLRRKAEYIYNDEIPQQVGGEIILGDSRSIKVIFEEKFDWIITSPPYYGMSTYKPDQWLRLWFLGGAEKVDYSNNQQIRHWSEEGFINDLAQVWRNCAKMSHKQAKLVIRFGAIPSKSILAPKEIIKESLKQSDCGWVVRTIKNAGSPVNARRQSNQFKNSAGKYIEEVDVFAALNN
jgi:DNA modification methylase